MFITTFGLLSLVCPCTVFSANLGNMARQALRNSVEIQKLENSIRASDLGVKEKWGQLTPSISLSASHTLTDQKKPADVDKASTDYTISVSQALYQPNLLSSHKEATLNSEIASVQLLQAHENLLKETISTILDICRLSSRLKVVEQSRDFIAKTVVIQEKMLKSGYGSKISLNEAEVELARYEKDYHELNLQLQLRLLDLANLTGETRSSKAFADLSLILQTIQPKTISLDQGVCVQSAISYNSQLMLIRLNQKINRISRDRVSNQFKPRVNLSFIFEQGDEEALVDYRTDQTSVELSLSMGFTPVSSYYQVQKQDVDQHTLVLEENKIERDLSNRIGHILRSIELKRNSMRSQVKWKTKQQTIVKMYQNGLKEKQIPVSQFLDSSRKYNESQVDLIQSVYSIWDDRIQLLQLAGQLTIEKIDKLSAELDQKAGFFNSILR